MLVDKGLRMQQGFGYLVNYLLVEQLYVKKAL